MTGGIVNLVEQLTAQPDLFGVPTLMPAAWQGMVLTTVAVVCAVLVGLALWVRWARWRPEAAVTASVLASVALGAATVWLLVQVETTLRLSDLDLAMPEGSARMVLSPEALDREAGDYRQLPTGLFLTYLSLRTAGDAAAVTGYLWQRGPDDGRLGVIPSGVEALKMDQAYQAERDGGIVRGWRFEAKFQERFDYARFPFDTKPLHLRLFPTAFADNVMLVPDLAAYEDLAPTALPGANRLHPEGWNKLASFFTLRQTDYDTDFGILDLEPGKPLPETGYTLLLQRQPLDVLVRNLSPIAMVVFFQFLLIMGTTGVSHWTELDRFKNKEFLIIALSNFFIVILTHIDFRADIDIAAITYIDWIYFSVYLIIALSSVNVVAINRTGSTLFAHGNNILGKALFMPVFLLMVFCATVLVYGS